MFKVKAHRNLNAPGKAIEWSISPLTGSHKNRVLGYADHLVLTDVYFRVQKGGVQRIRERGTRAVVAWAEGLLRHCRLQRLRYPEHAYEIPGFKELLLTDDYQKVRFDAFEGEPSFTLAQTGEPVTHADIVILRHDGSCFALGARNEISPQESSLLEPERPVVKNRQGTRNHSKEAVMNEINRQVMNENPECKSCGGALDAEGYCTDEACAYSEWPQYVEETDFYELSVDAITLKYGADKREMSGADRS